MHKRYAYDEIPAYGFPGRPDPFPGGQEHKSEKQAANEGPASGHKERAGDFQTQFVADIRRAPAYINKEQDGKDKPGGRITSSHKHLLSADMRSIL